MSVYRLTRFGDELLPRFDGHWQLSPAPALPAIRKGFAGPFDARIGRMTQPAARMVEFTATYLGNPDSQLTDEDGRLLTDESDNVLSLDQSADIQVERLTRLRGQMHLLERTRQSDGAKHYLPARLLSVDHQTRIPDGSRIATISPRFETAAASWRSADKRTVTASLDMSSAVPQLEGHNNGLMAATQAILELTFSRRGTSFSLAVLGAQAVWHWLLTFQENDPASGTWRIDAGDALDVSAPSAVDNPYTRWSLGPAHTASEFVWIPPGAFRLEVFEEASASALGEGTVDVRLQFYEEYP